MSEDRFDRFMTDSDGIMWTIERDPLLRSTIVAVMLLDRPPDPARLLAGAEQATHDFPRLRQVVVPTPLRLGPPRWAFARRFDVRNHLHHWGAPAPHDLGAVLQLAALFAETAFDRGQPLWELAVVDGLDDGRAACIMKLHHAMTDGVGGMHLLTKFVDFERDAAPHPVTPAPARTTVVAPLVALDGIAHTARQALRTAESMVAGAVHVTARAARDPLAVARAAVGTAQSLGRVLQPIDETLSPVMTGRSDVRRAEVMEFPLQRLKDAAHAIDGTLNDAFVGAIAGGLARYHGDAGKPVTELRMTMPISTRADDDPLGSNRLLPARFTIPVDIDDPRERMRAIGARCRQWQHEPALPMTEGIATVLDHLPARLTTLVFGSMLKHVDFLATNVPGTPVPIYLAGARVERFWAIAPPMGAAVNVSLISHEGTACIGVTIDPAAIADPPRFVAALRDGFEEIIASVEDTARKVTA